MCQVERLEQHWKWVAAGGAIASLVVLYCFSPQQYAIYPQCLFQKLCGLQCPGCGSLRSLHHLAHGEFGLAFRFNPLLYVLGSVLLIFRKHLHKPLFVWSVAAAGVAFAIARNL
jgi:hypothetical protein